MEEIRDFDQPEAEKRGRHIQRQWRPIDIAHGIFLATYLDSAWKNVPESQRLIDEMSNPWFSLDVYFTKTWNNLISILLSCQELHNIGWDVSGFCLNDISYAMLKKMCVNLKISF